MAIRSACKRWGPHLLVAGVVTLAVFMFVMLRGRLVWNQAVRESFLRLQPEYVERSRDRPYVRSQETIQRQLEFRHHGDAGLQLLERRLSAYLSPSRTFVLRLRVTLANQDVTNREYWAEGQRLTLGIEAFANQAESLVPGLRRQLERYHRLPNRRQFIATLISYAGKAAIAALCDELANPIPEIAEACRTALKSQCSRASTADDPHASASIDTRAFLILMDDQDPVLQLWAYNSVWSLGGNDPAVLRKVFAEAQRTDHRAQFHAIAALMAGLSTEIGKSSSFRSNYVSTFLTLLTNRKSSVRHAAVTALVKSGERGPRIQDGLHRAVHDSNSIVRRLLRRRLRYSLNRNDSKFKPAANTWQIFSPQFPL